MPVRSSIARPESATLGAELPLVSVIIVNYRRWEETAALVAQLLAGDSFHRQRIEVIIIDNASPVHPLEYRLGEQEGVRVYRLRNNQGFAAGVNVGLRGSRGRWILVLNPDLAVSRDFLDLVCAAAVEFDHEPDLGIVGFQLRNRDGSHQHSTGLFPTFWRMLAGLLRPRSCRKYQVMESRRRRHVPWVTGSCILARRECLTDLGGFDEDFFLYYEDVDLCLRARGQGWTVCYEPAIAATHLDPLQNRRPTSLLWAITRHGSLTYFAKHLAGWQFWTLAQIIRAEAWVRHRWALWHNRKEDAAICHQVRGFCRDFMRGRLDESRKRLDEMLLG